MSLVSKSRTRAGFATFAGAIAEMGLVSVRGARPAAALSIAAEFVVLALLAWPAGAVPGLAAATVLFAGFTIALTVAVRRGSNAGCHCFGASSSPVARRHVFRAAGLCAVSAAAFGAAAVSSAVPLAGIGAAQALIAVAVAGIGVAALVWLDVLAWLLRGPASTRVSRSRM
ncbi:hypothetical protein QLQ12_02350 [Actinoplanes sp. NEAU-A12]|uniref:Methylamine utilisation protein MauE domain-containing protein n=1 Tax=Actinoplanes sandaracinus TaxID=3045177 RepID=A0ABT6WCI4_9ACTN|nr:hypothetical protein [Actinoplanes sandaracinus]